MIHSAAIVAARRERTRVRAIGTGSNWATSLPSSGPTEAAFFWLPERGAAAAFVNSYVRGEDRGQAALLPAVIEDYLAADAGRSTLWSHRIIRYPAGILSRRSTKLITVDFGRSSLRWLGIGS